MMKFIKMNLAMGIACLAVLAWSGLARAVVLDDFEDGDYTSNPTWTITPDNPGYWSVVASPTGSLALRHQINAQQWNAASLPIEDIGTLDFELSVTVNTEVGGGKHHVIIGDGDGVSHYGPPFVAAELNYTGGYWRVNMANSGGDETGYTSPLEGLTKLDMQGKDYRYTLRREAGIVYFDLDDLSTPEVEDWHSHLVETTVTNLTGVSIQLTNIEGSAFGTALTRYYDNIELTLPGAFPPGDASGDYQVDETDAALLAANWLYGPDANWGMGDFNEDGVVDDKDATMMAANWHVGVPAAAVPEPSCLALLLGAALAGMFLRGSSKTFYNW